MGDVAIVNDPVFGCELVLGHLDKDGYALINGQRAHIAAWEAEKGPLKPGIELDHQCRRRNCRALHHLEPVTRAENEHRKKWRVRARRAVCPQGHDMRMNHVITPEGGCVCRTCNREARSGP